MTRILPLLFVATLLATSGFAGTTVFDMPNLTFPEIAGPTTLSTSGPAAPTPTKPQD